jgi:hypothetical protein
MEEPKQDPNQHTEHAAHAEHAVHTEHAEHPRTEHHRHHKKFFASKNLMIILSLVLVVVIVANAYIGGAFNAKQAIPTQTSTLAELQVVTINPLNCPLCFDVSQYSAALGQITGVNITSSRTLDMSSPEAQALISKYSITKLPMIIITGQINATAVTDVLSQAGEVRNGAFLLTAIPPPYYDTQSAKVVGLVSFTAITDSSCKNCTTLDSMVSLFQSAGIAFGTNTTYDYSWQQAKSLIGQYNITKLPAMILSSDLSVYTSIAQAWSTVGKIAADGSYIFTETPPPFKDLTTGKIVGIVNVTYLYSGNCTTCYNVSMHRDILEGYNVVFGAENMYDINSTQAKAIIAKYNITSVPTFVMSPDAKYYAALMSVWAGVGTNETDGWFVFRDMTVLSDITYIDLTTGKLVSASGVV